MRGSDFIPMAIAVALVVATPLVLQTDYAVGIGITIGIMAIAASGLVLLLGYAHQLAIGQAAFCIIGGYGSAMLTVRAGWDPALAAVLSAGVSMLVAYLIGRPILHLRGFVLAMGSLAVQLVLIHFAIESLAFTGGSMGLTGVPRFSVLGFVFATDSAYFYLVWALALLCVQVCRNVDRSRTGRALRAIAVSEAGAASLGIDIARHKVQMFVLSAGMASVAGSLTAHYLRIMEPQVFSITYSLNMLIAVIIGGLSSPWGGLVGAAALSGLREGLRVFSLPLVELLIVGVVTLGVLMAFPRGLVGAISRSFRRSAAPAAGESRPAITAADFAAAALTDRRPATATNAGGDLLVVDGVSRSFGNLKAVDGVGFEVKEGSITALIGPNGAGKTTLFNLVCGYEPVDSGSVTFEGSRIEAWQADEIARAGVGRTFQLVQVFEGMSVLENVMCGRNRFAATSLASIILRSPGLVAEERVTREKALAALALVGLAEHADEDPSALPFGLQRQVELARVLALEPRLLMMDEPASGLNDSETERLAELILQIRAAGTTVLLVEHDMRLVMGIADHLVVLDRGRKLIQGDPDTVRVAPEVVSAYLGGSAE